MTKKMYWGFAALIILLIAAGGFIYWQWSTVQQMKEQAAQDAKMLEEGNHKPKQPSVANKPPREAKDGFKWEWHGDHWHEMPIAQAPQQTPIVQPEQVKQPVKPTYTGPLTFHEELLKTNPVKAFQLQTEERGHWSAKWIPPFPPDDQVAQAYARARYLMFYYESIGKTGSPEFKSAVQNRSSAYRTIKDAPLGSARKSDLLKLTWPGFDEPIAVYDARGNRQQASDFFPIWRSEAEKRAAYGDFYDVFMEIEKLQEQGLLPE